MGIYLMLIIVALVLLWTRHSSLYKNIFLRSIIIFISILSLFIIYVFRSIHVGKDYLQYYDWFSLYDFSSSNDFVIEHGYAHLSDIARYFNCFYIIPIVTILLMIFSIFYIAKHMNNRINGFTLLSLFILLGIFTSLFDPMRQSIACSIIWIGLPLLFWGKRNLNFVKIINYLLFILIILVAFEFHKSSYFGLIFLAFPFVKRIKINKVTVILSGLVTTILFFSHIMIHVFELFEIKDPDYQLKYQKNLLYSSISYNQLLIRILPVLAQFVFFYIFISRYKNIKNNKLKFIEIGYLLYLFMFSAPGSDIARRLQMYTFIFPLIYSCIFLDGIYICGRNRNRCKCVDVIPQYIKIPFILFWVVFYVMKLIVNNSGIIPYYFV